MVNTNIRIKSRIPRKLTSSFKEEVGDIPQRFANFQLMIEFGVTKKKVSDWFVHTRKVVKRFACELNNEEKYDKRIEQQHIIGNNYAIRIKLNSKKRYDTTCKLQMQITNTTLLFGYYVQIKSSNLQKKSNH